MTEKNFKWYIVNVMAGQENKIASDIKSMIARGNIDGDVSDVLVPTKTVMKIKKGQKVQELQKLFPGYIFIHATMDGNVYNIINSIPKVMGFLGSKNNPQSVPEAKIQEIIGLISSQESSSKQAIFEIGEMVNVTEGPFESFAGAVENFDQEKQKVKISVSIFGRATSVELDVNQVEKVS